MFGPHVVLHVIRQAADQLVIIVLGVFGNPIADIEIVEHLVIISDAVDKGIVELGLQCAPEGVWLRRVMGLRDVEGGVTGHGSAPG